MERDQIELREAQADDAPALASLLHAAFEQYRGKLDPPSGVHLETAATLRAKMLHARAVLASLNGKTAGCVFYEPQGQSIYLGRLAVLPAYRRHGIARALVAYVETQARARGIPRVQLGVRLALPQLIAYYEGLGYRIVSYERHAGYPEPTYVFMEKAL